MLLEMQSAMNNMMNNSQLHNQLHSSQTLPIAKPLPACAINPTSEDAGPAPSCSPASSPCLSQSDSSSDPEPAISMDTSPSSASPSASDSSEEEVIGSVTRAHQETFMYNQEQSELTAEAPPSAALQNAAVGNVTNHRIEERQVAWNHHNNLVTMAAQDPPSTLGHQGQEDIGCPFRGSKNSSGHCPAYAHGAFKTQAAETPAHGTHVRPLWRGGNRMHLVRRGRKMGVRDKIFTTSSTKLDTFSLERELVKSGFSNLHYLV